MMKGKKIVSLLLALSVAVSMASCGKKPQEVKVDANGNYVVPEEKLELTVWETQGTDYAAKPLQKNDIVAQWLMDKTNVEVKNMYGNDGGAWDAKLTKLVAGDNLPEIIKCGSFQGPAHFNKVKQLNQLFELTPEMIQKYAPNLWNRTPKEFWDAMTSDGKIMGIPYRNDEAYDEPFAGYDQETIEYIRDTQVAYTTDVTYQSTQYLYIRDDILKMFYPEAKTYDELVKILEETNEPIGDIMLDVPIYTTEEFIDFLYKIQQANLKENGKTVYPLGYNGGDNWMALSWIGADMLGYKNHYYSGTINAKTKEYELMIASDTVKEAAQIQNKLINDEVIESESLAHTTALYKEKVLNGQYAIAAVQAVGNVDQINAELARLGKSFRYRPFITQVPNKEEYPAFKEKVLWHNAFCFTKELSEEQVIQVLNWINVQYSEEFEEIVHWGPKEADLYTEENGVRKFKDERFNKYFLEGDSSALKEEETMGLGKKARGSMMPVYPLFVSKYEPVIYNRVVKYFPNGGSGFRFKEDSKHVENVIPYPPTQIWSSIYADIPEVVDFWSAREQWESKITIALASEPEEFEQRWQDMIDTISDIVDIEALEKACTEAAKPYMNN